MKILFTIIGIISLGLGIIGAFLPLLPTTPFVLLSAVLFAKSSDKLHQWLLNHKIFGRIITNFRDKKEIPVKAKIISIGSMWIMNTFSIFFILKDKLWLQILLGAITIGVTIYILSFKTGKK